MCRLLGIIANKRVNLQVSMKAFGELAERNQDGWGIGWYDGQKAKCYKEGRAALDAKSGYSEMGHAVRSRLIISHVRNQTTGEPSEENSHPFAHEGQLFAHNGRVDIDHLQRELNAVHRSALVGSTDSEVFFHTILQKIEEEDDMERGIRHAVSLAKESDHTGLNFLLSDGRQLMAYRDGSRNPDYYSLFICRRDDPGNAIAMEHVSEETKMLLRSKTLAGEKAVLVCSEPIPEEDEAVWEPIEWGTLVTIDGELEMKSVRIRT